MGLQDIYYSWEEKWYGFLDSLDAKGIPVYKVVDPIDKVVPSFALVLAIIAILLLGLIYGVALQFGLSPDETVVITFQDKAGNPIPNLDVSINFGPDNTKSFTTNETGTIRFEVAPDSNLIISGTFQDEDFTKPLHIGDTASYTVTLDFYTQMEKVSFKLQTVDGSPLSPVNLYFDCSDSDESPDDMYNVTDSEIEVEVVPDCGNLLVTVSGNDYDEIASFEAYDDAIIQLTPLVQTGNNQLAVSVVDDKGQLVDSVDLTLYTGELDTLYTTQSGVLNGTYTFTGLSMGSYKVVAVKDGYIQEGDARVVFTSDNETKSVSIVLKPAQGSAGYLAVKVFDGISKKAVVAANVCFYKQNDMGNQGDALGCVESDANGLATMNVADSSLKYYINVTRQGYKGKFVKNVEADAAPTQIYLSRITSTENCLSVKVVDADGEPVGNAVVNLYDENDNLLPAGRYVTDFNGLVKSAFCVDAGNYKVYAYKGKFNGMSEVFSFDPDYVNEEYDVEVRMDIPYATLHLNIKDSFGNVVPNAVVLLYDSYGKVNFEGAKISDPEGQFIKERIRADKKIYFVVSKEGYEKYVSIAKFLTPDAENVEQVVLDKLSLNKNPRIKVVGVYNLENKPVQKVAAGELYKLRFKIVLPKDQTPYKKLYATFVAGKEDVVEKEMFYFEKVDRSGFTAVFKGRRYVENDEEEATNVDRQVINEVTEGMAFEDEAKWVQLRWDLENLELDSGVLYADVYFRTRDEMKENTQLNFYYDISVKKGDEELFYPLDKTGVLGSKVNNKNPYIVFSGKGQQVCDDKFCVEASIFDEKEEVISDLVGQEPYVANVGKNYDLEFTIMNVNDKPLTNYRLIVENPQESLYFMNYKIVEVNNSSEDVDLTNISNVANNYKIVKRSTKPLETNNAIKGRIVLTPNRIGNASIKFKIYEDNRLYYEKEYYFNVYANKDLNVKVEPKVIPSYAPVNLDFEVRDGESGALVKDADIRVKDEYNTLIASVKTNEYGKATIPIPGQKPNVALTVNVFSENYKPYILKLKTDPNFLQLTPETLKISAKIPDKKGKADLKIKNISKMKVSVKEIKIKGNFDEYIDVDGVNTYLIDAFAGKEIDAEHNYVFPIVVNLTYLADALKENRSYDADLIVTFGTTNLLWTYTIPMKVDLVFGKGLDNLDCLSVDVKEGKLISTDSKQIHDMLMITNGCTVNGQPVALRNLEAKIKWKGNSLGSLVLGKDEREVKIQQAYYRTLALQLTPELEETYTVNIIPKSGNIIGDGKVEVLLRASYMTSNGLQFVEAKTKYDVSVIKMHDCFSFELPDSETDLIKVRRDKEASFKVKNLCDTEMDLRFDSLPKDFLKIRPTKFRLKGKSEKTIKIDPANSPVGVYLLELRSKTKGTTYEAVKAGIEGFRVFVQPLESDCIVLDNYEYDLWGTSATDNNMRFGYIINKCAEKPVQAQYQLKIKADSFSGRSWANLITSTLVGGAGGLITSLIAPGAKAPSSSSKKK